MTNGKNIDSETISLLLNSSKGAHSRKNILKNLLACSKSCNQIAIDLKLNWHTTYRHLQILEKKNLIDSFSFGQRRLYKLTLKGEFALKKVKNRKMV